MNINEGQSILFNKIRPCHVSDKDFISFSMLYDTHIKLNSIYTGYRGAGKTKVARWLLLKELIKNVKFKPVNICQYLRKSK